MKVYTRVDQQAVCTLNASRYVLCTLLERGTLSLHLSRSIVYAVTSSHRDHVCSKSILEQRALIAQLIQLIISIFLLNLLLRNILILLVMRPIEVLKRQRRYNSSHSKRQARSKARRVSRALTGQENERARKASQVTDADHERDAHGSLLCVGQVIDSPCVAAWQDWVYADAGEEDHGVAEGHVLGDAWSEDEEDGVGDDQNTLRGDSEGHAPCHAVCEVRAEDCCDGAAGVWRCGQELGSRGRVAHVADDL
jgi:hypothetical protein